MQIALVIFLAIHAVARPYKQQFHNIIDLLLLADVAISNVLSLLILSFGTSEAGQTFQLILLYLPLACIAVAGILLLLRKYSIFSRFPSANSGETLNFTHCISKKSEKAEHQKEYDEDDDLFVRAAELNHPPQAPGGSEASHESTPTTENI